MSKQGYYIYESLFKNGKLVYPGVQKKIDSQISQFEAHGYHTEAIVLEETATISQKIKKRLPFFVQSEMWEKAFSRMESPCFIYIRRPLIEAGIVRFTRKVKKHYPECKIILELYTYPYDRDDFLSKTKFLKMLPCYCKELFNRRRLYRSVDRIATYSDHTLIWKIPTINIVNGVDVASIEKTSRTLEPNRKEIHLISVATMQSHHGYDRVLKGLQRYYAKNTEIKNTFVCYNVVGNGAELKKYIKFVEDNGLSNYVKFYGLLSGDSLRNVYNFADVAIGSLGMHRLGLKIGSTLKTREYLARGIPFVYAGEIDVFQNKAIDFALAVPSDESPIDIEKIVEFYQYLSQKYQGNSLSSHIRKFAVENVDISIAFMPIINYIANKEKS